jgi:hypothetical protein
MGEAIALTCDVTCALRVLTIIVVDLEHLQKYVFTIQDG